MATVPADSSWTSARRDSAVANWALAAGLLFCLAYAVAPGAAAARNLGIYAVAELLVIAAIVAGVRTYRPPAPAAWLLIAAGLSLYWIADVMWGVYEATDRDPFPSPADAFYLAGYPLIAAGLAVAVRRRRSFGVDRRVVIDAALVTVIAGLLAWIYIVEPALDDPALSGFETVVTIAYPCGDVLLVALAARFVMGSSWNVRSLRLLVLGLAFTLAGDVVFSTSVIDSAHADRVSGTLLLIGTVLVGVAALDPSMRALTDDVGDPSEQHDTARVVLLGAVCLVPPFVLIVQEARGDPLYLGPTLTAMVVISGLVIARFTYTTGRARRAAQREAALSRFAAELLVAGGRDELIAAAHRTAIELVGDRGGAQLIVPPLSDPVEIVHAFRAPVEVRGKQIAELVADPTPAQLRRVRDSLTTVATQLSLALEREQLLATERETADTLTEQNEQLRELDRMKDTFVSSVSHELRTPLTSMVGYLEIIRDGEVGELNDEQQHFLEIVDRNCHRLNDLIGDLLETARIDTGRFKLEREPVDVAELAAQQVESIRAPAEAKHVDVQLVIEEHPPPLCADPMRLGQLFDNLLSNAVKFTPDGGSVTVTVDQRDHDVRLEVSDTGVGIPHDELDKIFERFVRASTAQTTAGTGLGLPIAKAIAEAHDGTISVRSEVGVGTTFLVDLPLPADAGETETTDPCTEVIS